MARGRIDIRATIHERAARRGHVVSYARDSTLDHDISRTLICAENALRYLTGSDTWQTQPVRDVCARMRAGVGPRPRLPTEAQLQRIAYTPIRRPFKSLVAFSHRIARRRGFLSRPTVGKADAVLLDVAELWELFLVSCARVAYHGLDVKHGTRALERSPVHLFRSIPKPEVGFGRLYPDILVVGPHGAVAVLDAKYKHLASSPDRPDGVDRGDRYQIAAYLSRFRDDDRTFGALLYPEGMGDTSTAKAEYAGPWSTHDGNTTYFVRVPVTRDRCIEALVRLVKANETPTATRA
jgi:5-methylcytosine-specific restriction enzyme subunit McrC